MWMTSLSQFPLLNHPTRKVQNSSLVTCLTDTTLRSNRDSKSFITRIKEDRARIHCASDVEASRTGNSDVGICRFQSNSGNERPTQLETPCRLLTAPIVELG